MLFATGCSINYIIDTPRASSQKYAQEKRIRSTFYPVEIKKHADPRRDDVAAFSVLDKIQGITRGPGGVVCMYDNLVTLKHEDKVIPVKFL